MESVEAQPGTICEFRIPNGYPLPGLIVGLKRAIGRAEVYTSVDHASRVRGWLRALERLQQQNTRLVLDAIVHAFLENTEKKKQGLITESEVWQHPFQDDLRCMLDARMFVMVVKYLEARLSSEHWRDLVKGKLRPEEDNQNTRPRDRLVELYIAAAASRAGLDVDLCEPDFAVTIAGQRYGIAVKRLKSDKTLMERAEYGAKQVTRATGLGLVFIDVCNLMNRDMRALRYFRGYDPSKSGGSVHGTMMKFVSENQELRQLIEGSRVDGIILRHACPAIWSRPFTQGTVETWTPVVERPSKTTATLYRALLDALAPDPRLDPHGPSGYVPCEFYYTHPQRFKIASEAAW